ncbi:MAG TPA: Hsp20/alpha crystallin family protein [Dehalococcoidia bacterium]
MAGLIRWDPFSEIQQMRETVDRLFEELWPFRWSGGNGSAQPYGYVPVDVRETDEAVEVLASLPGVRPEDVDVQVHGNTVTIKGRVEEEQQEQGATYLRRERRSGAFLRSLALPAEVDADRAEATVEHGVLRLRLPKAEAARPKTIKVSARPALEGEKA